MRVLILLLSTFFNAGLIAADFQLPDYTLGVNKTEMKADVLTKTTVSLFGAEAAISAEWTEDKLSTIQLSFYQGNDYEALKKKADLLLQQLTTTFGSVIWISSDAEPAVGMTTEQQSALLDQMMKMAPESAAGYKQSHLANSTFVLDFQPAPQPDNCRVHLAVIYSSFSNEYRLLVYIDEKSAPERTAGAIVNLEAF